ncbi:hypothetical protein CCHOA_03975 [Corynebacterium choanae]|uniref:Uncharacterized protein n=1 Tax=Corynebacterium choanae TaxID=1862358 RepID=A0A3G6JB20_9CORY|nr:hypothetical protein CCHOA_03975 [Corynebacterium choanae]
MEPTFGAVEPAEDTGVYPPDGVVVACRVIAVAGRHPLRRYCLQ